MDSERFLSTATPPMSAPSQKEISTSCHGPVGSTACTNCRNMHLRCDRLSTCSRCSAQKIKCVYLKSRRGYSRPDGAADRIGDAEEDERQTNGELEIFAKGVTQGQSQNNTSTSSDLQRSSIPWEPPISHSRLNNRACRQRCIAAFFHYFYDSHPFIIPYEEFLQQGREDPPDHLEKAICVVGAQYVPSASAASFSAEFDCVLANTSRPKDASMVQAMLLFALYLGGCNEQQRAAQILMEAQTLALELGMNEPDFAILNSSGSRIYEESLRRTWWELYIVITITAGFYGRGKIQVFGQAFNLPLPCEEKQFASGCIPPLHLIEEFDDRSFTCDEIEWSSYTYRIAAARNLERILQSNVLISWDNSATYRHDSNLVSWALQLPASKVSYFDQFGAFDEMLFQAHMITNVSSILLHRHSSGFDEGATQTSMSCIVQTQGIIGFEIDSIHALKTAQAASNISKLVALPIPLLKHTHFFVCALALSSITHLSIWSALPPIAPDQDLKSQILMNLGGLKAVGGAFPVARTIHSQVAEAARKIYANRGDVLSEAFWFDFTDADMMASSSVFSTSLDTTTQK